VEVIVIPPSCYLGLVKDALGNSSVALGAQNMYPAEKGAYTGELSGTMLKAVGCDYVLCGHSERRALFGETSEWVGNKVAWAHRNGLTPILCVGETLEERDAGRVEIIISNQLSAGLKDLDEMQIGQMLIAYEPVWAIGTGRTATPEQAQDVHAFIRGQLVKRIGESTSTQVRILYGGSVKPQNAAALLAQPDIDGALVGGASLDLASFTAIIDCS
jgi:triosephosphate isomerase